MECSNGKAFICIQSLLRQGTDQRQPFPGDRNFIEKRYDVTVYPTKPEMDGCETVEKRAKEFDLIVCSGGDGTLDEVVTGLLRSGQKRVLGIHSCRKYE